MNKQQIGYMVLAMIFLSGLFLRIYPVSQFSMPLKYDSYYHIRVAELIKNTGTIPLYEPWPYGGRPHIYPPLYHISIVGLNILTGIDIIDVVRFFLPIVSAFTILIVFWLVKKFSNQETAILAALFTAINPYLISSSYDSPEVIGLMLSCFAVYFLLKKRYWEIGIVLSVTFFFNTFSALAISGVFAVYLLLSKQVSKIPKTFTLPALSAAIWYLPRANLLYCYDNTIGPTFIAKAMGTFMMQEAVIAVSALLVTFALMNKLNGPLQKFYTVWVLYFCGLLLSFAVTNSFHPWRQNTFISFGFSIFLPLVINQLRALKKILFTAVFMFLFMLGITYIAMTVQSFTPPLVSQEYSMISWADKNLPDDSIILAQHDLCANLLTLTNRSCVLDISFECLQDKSAFYDYESFFWVKNNSAAQEILNKYPVTHILYRWNQYYDELIDKTRVNRVYTSWACTKYECQKAAALYEKLI